MEARRSQPVCRRSTQYYAPDELKVRRVMFDGLAGLADALAFPERGHRFLGRLLVELKHRDAT
ncbi:hypothetical protein APY03_2354 [Variovorax sp. WDL1]|nr:hypothetical protein APY03_2354 [Variovorax sp. WDL1]